MTVSALITISDNWNHLMRLRDMKYIGFKHQRENKQNRDNLAFQSFGCESM
jgi:hypothetical protein